MRISAPGTSEAGLTLVELLVVLAIMGLTAGAVLLTASDGEAPISEAALQFERDVASLRDASVARVQTYALKIEPGGYGRYLGEAEGWRLLGTEEFPRGVDILVSAGEGGWDIPEHEDDVGFPSPDDDDEQAFEPDAVFTPEGSVTPLSVTFRDGDRSVVLSVDSFGQVRGRDAR